MSFAKSAVVACVVVGCLLPGFAAAAPSKPANGIDDALKQIFHGQPTLAQRADVSVSSAALKGPTWSYDFMTNCIRKFVGPVGFVGSPVCLTWGGYKN